MTLRAYQAEAVEASLRYLRNGGGDRGVLIAPTGSGKSHMIAEIVRNLDGDAVVFQPSREILEQNAAKLVAASCRPAIHSASLGRREVGRVTLATIGSVRKTPELFSSCRYVLVDECHLVNPKKGMYRTFLEELGRTKILGLTATPYRLASNSWGSELRFLTRTRPRVFRDVVHHTQIGDLFRQGFLSPLRYREIPAIDLARLKVNSTGADYTDESVKRHFREISFPDRLVEGVGRLLESGRQSVVVFTRFTAEAEEVASGLGSRAAVVTAKTPPVERRRILEDFKAGRYQVVCNVGIIALGFDFPSLDTVVLARPTRSLALYYQQVGRAIRPHAAKKWAAVVDLVGLVRTFGKIEDLELRPGGVSGQKWAVWSGRRQLTNVYLDGVDQRGAPA